MKISSQLASEKEKTLKKIKFNICLRHIKFESTKIYETKKNLQIRLNKYNRGKVSNVNVNVN